MSTPDIFALGGRDETQDVGILALFREWLEGERALDRYAREKPKDLDGYNVRNDRLFDLLDEIEKLPAGSAVGLAIKVYILAWSETGGHDKEPPALGNLTADDCISTRTLLSLVRDLPRFVPEIAPLIRYAEGGSAS